MKSLERGTPIEYAIKPRKIKVVYKGEFCVCDNCAGYGDKQYTYAILYNKSDYGTPNGNIGKKRYAKPRELWLCKDCLQELYDAIGEILKEDK